MDSSSRWNDGNARQAPRDKRQAAGARPASEPRRPQRSQQPLAERDTPRRGGKLVISQPSERVKDVLDLAGLESLFPVYESTVAALASE